MADSTRDYPVAEQLEPATAADSVEWLHEFVGFHRQVCGQPVRTAASETERQAGSVEIGG